MPASIPVSIPTLTRRLVLAALVALAGASVMEAQEILVSGHEGGAIVALSAESERVLASGEIAAPAGVTFGADGFLYVASSGTARILRVGRASGQTVDIFIEDPRLEGVEKIAFGPDGDLYAASPSTNQILRFDAELRSFESVAAEGSGLDAPRSFVFGADGLLYVASFGSNAVLRYDGATGAFVDTFASTGLTGPNDLSFGPDGQLYVSSGFTGQVLRFDAATGGLLDIFADDPSLEEAFGIAFGPAASLYVANASADELRVFDGASGVPMGVLRASDAIAPAMRAPRFLVLDRPEEVLRVDPIRTTSVPLGFAVEGASPGGRVAVVFGTPAGETTLQECPGIRLNDINALKAEIRVADGSGRVLLFGLPGELAGERNLSVQTVDLRTCVPSEVLELTLP